MGADGHLVDTTGHLLNHSCYSSPRGCCWSSGRYNWSSTRIILVPVLCVGAAGHLVDTTGHLLVSFLFQFSSWVLNGHLVDTTGHLLISFLFQFSSWRTAAGHLFDTTGHLLVSFLFQFSSWVLLVIWSIQLVIYSYHSCSSSPRGCCWSSGRYNWSSTHIILVPVLHVGAAGHTGRYNWSSTQIILVPVLCVGAAGHLVDTTGHLLYHSCSSSPRGCCWSSGRYNWSSTRIILVPVLSWVLLVIWSIQLVIYSYHSCSSSLVGAAGHLVDTTGHLLVSFLLQFSSWVLMVKVDTTGHYSYHSCSSSLHGCCWSSGRYNWSSTRIILVPDLCVGADGHLVYTTGHLLVSFLLQFSSWVLLVIWSIQLVIYSYHSCSSSLRGCCWSSG